MALTLKNVKIIDCHTGISAPKDAQIDADGLEITNATHRAIELRDPPGLFQSLGLPENTPPAHLIEALKILEDAQNLPESEKIERLRGSPLIEWLGSTADLVTVGTMLLGLQAQGVVSAALERIFS